MSKVSRVALFADTFHETNGAANFLRRLVDFAKAKDYPFLCIRSGEKTESFQDGSVTFLDLKRGKGSIPLDGALRYDPFLWKHRKLVGDVLTKFSPEVVHITGLNDISQLGIFFAHFRDVPAVATWHTNAHEYASHRLQSVIPFLSCTAKQKLGKYVEKALFYGLMKAYFLAQMQLAPNEELVSEIQRCTHRPSFLLRRGVDTDFFSPQKRQRNGEGFTLGFVGRLRPEKNVRFFGEIDSAFQIAGIDNYKFLFVGDGSEKPWLEKNLHNVEFTGEIRGEPLARAYANMDLFVFPSQTDAFGNVVLEAMSSGVPPIVMSKGGQKFLIEHNKNGFVVEEEEFVDSIVNIVRNSDRLCEMKTAARKFAEENSWDAIFGKTFAYYAQAMKFDKKIRV